jgi:hypothetical protein
MECVYVCESEGLTRGTLCEYLVSAALCRCLDESKTRTEHKKRRSQLWMLL